MATCIPNTNSELAEADGAPQPMEDTVSKYKALEEQHLSLTSGFHMHLYVGLHKHLHLPSKTHMHAHT